MANIVALASDEKSEFTGNKISESFLILPSQNGGNSGWNLFSEVGTSRSWKVTSNHLKLKEAFQMDAKKIRQQWESRGFSFGIFRDPPGRVWQDFSHSTDELVILAEAGRRGQLSSTCLKKPPALHLELLGVCFPCLLWNGSFPKDGVLPASSSSQFHEMQMLTPFPAKS